MNNIVDIVNIKLRGYPKLVNNMAYFYFLQKEHWCMRKSGIINSINYAFTDRLTYGNYPDADTTVRGGEPWKFIKRGALIMQLNRMYAFRRMSTRSYHTTVFKLFLTDTSFHMWQYPLIVV